MTQAENINDFDVGVLVEEDLITCFERGQLIKDREYEKENVEACSYDLRIGTIFREGKKIDKNSEDSKSIISIKSGEIINLFTLEEVNLPANVAATVFPINSQSSKGLLVLNPGHIDPGYQGPLIVKAVNFRKTPFPIEITDKILTIIFYILPKPTKKPYAKSQLRRDKERDFRKEIIKQGTKNLSDIVVLEKDNPYVKEQDVERLIKKHWLSWLSFILTFIAAIAAVIAVIISIISLQN